MLYTHWWYFLGVSVWFPSSHVRWSVPIVRDFQESIFFRTGLRVPSARVVSYYLTCRWGCFAHVGLDVVFLEEATSFWIVPLFLGTKQKKTRIPFFWGQIFRQKLWNRLMFQKQREVNSGHFHGFFVGHLWEILMLNPLKRLWFIQSEKEHPWDHLKQVDPFFLFLWGEILLSAGDPFFGTIVHEFFLCKMTGSLCDVNDMIPRESLLVFACGFCFQVFKTAFVSCLALGFLGFIFDLSKGTKSRVPGAARLGGTSRSLEGGRKFQGEAVPRLQVCPLYIFRSKPPQMVASWWCKHIYPRRIPWGQSPWRTSMWKFLLNGV